MKIIELNNRQHIPTDIKLSKLYAQLTAMLHELKNRELPQHIIASINQNIEQVNASLLSGNELKKHIKQKQTAILKLLEKELKLVPKNHYRTLWMLFGMSGIGLPIGVMFGLGVGNIGLLGIGLPIGMAIGLAIGAMMDKKALDEGRQLNVEIKY